MDTQAHRQAIVDKVSGAGKARLPLAAVDEPCISACCNGTPLVRASLARGAPSTSPARLCGAPLLAGRSPDEDPGHGASAAVAQADQDPPPAPLDRP